MPTTKSTHRRTRKSPHNGRVRHKDIKKEAEELLYHTLGEVRDRSEGVTSIVTDYVQEQPFKALGIALATGAVLALLFRR